jgi:hypothetical protein
MRNVGSLDAEVDHPQLGHVGATWIATLTRESIQGGKGINTGRHSNLLYEAIEEDKANGLKLSRKAVLVTSIVIILLAEGIELQLYERAAARVTHVASPRILMLRGKSKIRNAEVTQGSHDTDGGREHLCTRTWFMSRLLHEFQMSPVEMLQYNWAHA